MNQSHWNYFLSIESDLVNLTRYIEFTPDNMNVFSVELARILMASTQEVDVLAKQICTGLGKTAKNEQGYRSILPVTFPAMLYHTVFLPRFDIECVPFHKWSKKETPDWWVANNKVKHERHDQFSKANLENMLNSVSGLFIMNMYYYHSIDKLKDISQGTRLLVADGFVKSTSPTILGDKPNYEIP